MLILFSSFVFVAASSPALYSQPHLFDARILSTGDGLANMLTTSVYKDKSGFLWAGTAYGLNRYDGYNFKLFTKEENALFSNTNNIQIREDADGRLWLFYRYGNSMVHSPPVADTIDAVDVLDPKTKQAVPFDALFSDEAPFKAAEICLPKIVDHENRLWIHTNKGELFLHADGRFKKIFQREGVFFEYITFDQADNIWLGWRDSLMYIDAAGNILEKAALPGQVLGIWTGPDQTVRLATREGEAPGGRVRLWRKPENDPLIPFGLTRDGQPVDLQAEKAFLHVNQKGYWFVIIENQLHLFDFQGKWLCNYKTPPGRYFDFGSVVGHCEDGAGLWLASPTGLLKVSARVNPFQLIHRRDSPLSDCRGITEDDNGHIYFLNVFIYQWDGKTKKCRKVSKRYGAYFLLHTNNKLLSGTYGAPCISFQLDLGTTEETCYTFFNPAKSLVYSLAKTNKPHRYLAGLNKGLAYLDLEQPKILPYTGGNPNEAGDQLLEQSEVNHIHENPLGYWLATSNGIFLLKEDKGVIRHYDKLTGDLPFNHILHIYEDKEGFFWLATKGGGVIRWRPQSPEGEKQSGSARSGEARSHYRQFTAADVLTNDVTYAVYEDNYGKLWIPSDKGLMQMDKASFRVRTFTTDNGLPHDEFNHTSHYQAKDGTLYFGGLGGLIAFHPKVFVEENVNSTPLAFTGYYVLEEGADKMTDKTQLLDSSTGITIRPGDKFFELHFALLDYDADEKHRYAYQIEGYSNNWNYINEHFVRITNLPYGDYTLRIKGQNNSQGWTERELALAIHIARPFYLQWWFITPLALLLAGAIRAAVQWRIRNLKKGKERLEVEVQKRTLTIQKQAEELKTLDNAKTRFFSNITHEFRTPLTLIIGPLEQIISEQPPPIILRRRLDGVLKNGQRLLNLINQILELSKIESGRMTIEAARGDLVAYTKELIGNFEPLATKKELYLSFITHQNCWETQFDKDKWDKIVYNLLSNAIKFTPPGNAVQVSLSSTQKNGAEFIRLDVKDTGIGIEKEKMELVFDRFYQADGSSIRDLGGAGIGLSLVKELVELQGGQIRVASEPDKGASFELFLPVLPAGQAIPLAGNGPAAESWPVPVLLEGKPALERKQAPADSQEKLELLLIEDNAEMREYIRYCIGEDRYNITEAADGEEGIEKAHALIPDLIISDVMMPKKNGFSVIQAIRGNLSTSHIPLILLTAKASLENRLEGLRRGADAYLTKPFSPQELALHIEKLIEIRRMLRQRYQSGASSPAEDAYRQEDEFITKLRAYILEHIDETDLSGDHIGRRFGMSRVHLYRKLKALTGKPVTEFVMAVRLQKALGLLREGKYNVSEVAYQTGFSSVSHFSRSFKKAYGKSPSEV